MDQNDRKFYFDVNIFDAPPKEEAVEDLPPPPPPPPTFSEEELGAAKDIAFEQGRQQGQREQREARETEIAQTLAIIAENFSRLFAAETVRENIFEKESPRLAIAMLDLLFPVLNDKLGHDEVRKIIEKTLIAHRKTKEITISVPTGMKGETETLISRIRSAEHEEALWRVNEVPSLSAGDCMLEWSDGGAVRDSVRTARDIRRNIEAVLGESLPETVDLSDSDLAESDVLSKGKDESAQELGE